MGCINRQTCDALQPLHICKFDVIKYVKKNPVPRWPDAAKLHLMAYRVSDLLCFIHYTFKVQASPILQCEFKSRIKSAITISIHQGKKKKLMHYKYQMLYQLTR